VTRAAHSGVKQNIMAKFQTLPHSTRNDLPAATRARVGVLLNARLADTIDLQLQAKQAHWNVKGPNFIALHELFDKVADAAEEAGDLLAERLVALGGRAEGTVQAVGRRTTLRPYSLTLASGADHVQAVADALATVARASREAIDDADRAGDKGTSDLFTELSRDLDKLLWLVEAHLQSSK
jgi:starvation-inducible DNA-binding protein